MSHSWVTKIELNKDDTISLYLTVEGFDEGTLIELSGTATQAHGAVASFYSVQAVPAVGANGAPMEVKSVPTVPTTKFVASAKVTVIARATEVWITSLGPPAAGANDWGSNNGSQAAWTSTSDGPALCATG